MTNKEVISELKYKRSRLIKSLSERDYEVYSKAIKSLEKQISLEDIKSEIEHFVSDDTTDEYQNGAIDMRDYVLRVIDKYIGKENK